MTQHHIDHHDIADGVDAHKDLHVTAAVDTYERMLVPASFLTTQHGYKTMLTWIRNFG